MAHIYDNSRLNQPPERVISCVEGKFGFVSTQLPDWALRIYREDIGTVQGS